MESCPVSNWERKHKHVLTKDPTVNHFNQHFSAISTDHNYKIPPLKDTDPQDLEEFTEWRVYRMLDTINLLPWGWMVSQNGLSVLQPQPSHGL